MFRYLQVTKGLSFIQEGNAFILYKDNNGTLEIHDVYSEDGLIKILELRERLINKYKPIFLEGYVDKWYDNKERSHELMIKDGFKVSRESDDYIYYVKKVDYERI